MKRKKSRLTRKEEAKSIRRAIVYGGLTFILALGLIFLGIPLLIKMAIFLGNLRSSSLPVETKDTFPPPPPILKSLPEATNSAQINIQGYAEAGATVKIFLPGEAEKEIVADKEGSFALADMKLTPGKNQIQALAVDEAGNASQKSEKLIIFYDESPPEVEISEPAEGASFFGEENQIEIKGKTEEGATVYINEHLVVVDREGNFQYPVMLKGGENSIQILVTDKAGNETTKEIVVNYSL